MERNILVFNNHTGVMEIMSPLFAEEGINIQTASDWKELLEMLEHREVQLLLMDVEMADQTWESGIKLLKNVRERSCIPIIVLSAQDADAAKVMTLDAGADDYVIWGCNPMELLARVKSQIRRYTQLKNVCANIDSIYKVDGLEINDKSRTVTVEGKEVKLTPIEYKILRLLVQQRGRVLSINQIYESIWHMRAIGADNTIAVHIRHIREKIESNPKEPRYLKVVWGNGYKVG